MGNLNVALLEKHTLKNFMKFGDKGRFDREAFWFTQIIQKNPRLTKCSQEDLFSCFIQLGTWGLTLNPTDPECYLITRNEKVLNENGFPIKNGSKDVYRSVPHLMPKYTGLRNAAIRDTDLIDVDTKIIYEGDDVDIDYSKGEAVTKHRPYRLVGKPRGDINGVYARFIYPEGREKIEVMWVEDIHDEVRSRSDSWKSYQKKLDAYLKYVEACEVAKAEGSQMPSKAVYKPAETVWHTDKGEMYRKAVIKRGLKHISKKDGSISEMIKADNKEYVFPASDKQKDYAIGLAAWVVSGEKLNEAEGRIENMDSHEIEEFIQKVKEKILLLWQRVFQAQDVGVGAIIVKNDKPCKIIQINNFGSLELCYINKDGSQSNKFTSMTLHEAQTFEFKHWEDVQEENEAA